MQMNLTVLSFFPLYDHAYFHNIYRAQSIFISKNLLYITIINYTINSSKLIVVIEAISNKLVTNIWYDQPHYQLVL
jgi:hypothetical protein